MATTVGTSGDFATLIENMLSLERDAIAAYEATIERLEDAGRKQTVAGFKADHERHVAELERLAREHDATIPDEGDLKQMLTTGKVKLGGLMGEGALLKAMSSNEDDTIAAYRHAVENDAVPASAKPVFEAALSDERRHKAWMDEAAAAA